MKIIDVIKYEGDNKTFVWRYPEEDLFWNILMIKVNDNFNQQDKE